MLFLTQSEKIIFERLTLVFVICCGFTLPNTFIAMIEFSYKLLYLCIYGAYGVIFPYIPIFFDALQMNKSQIGIISMLPNICSFFVAPIFGVVADKFNVHSELIIVTILISIICTYSMLFMTNFSHMFVAVLIASIFRAPIGPQIDSMVISSLDDKSTYGNYRLWGAIGYGLSVFMGGLLTDDHHHDVDEVITAQENRNNFRVVFSVYSVTTLIGACTVLYLVYIQILKKQDETILDYLANKRYLMDTSNDIESVDKNKYVGNSPSSSNTDGDTVEIELSSIHNSNNDSYNEPTVKNRSSDNSNNQSNGDVVGSISALFQENPSIYVFCLIVFLSGVGSGCIEAFLFLRLKQLHATGLLMGISRFITCAAEVPMFQVAGYLQARFGTWPVLAVTQVAFVVRFTYYSLLENPWTVLPCEMLHGLTYATLWNVSCTYASVIAPPGCNSTVQALLEGLHWGFGAGVGALVGGYLYDYYGAVILFQLSAVMAGISLGLSIAACVYCSNSIGNNINKVSSTDSSSGTKKSSDNVAYSNVPLDGTEEDL